MRKQANPATHQLGSRQDVEEVLSAAPTKRKLEVRRAIRIGDGNSPADGIAAEAGTVVLIDGSRRLADFSHQVVSKYDGGLRQRPDHSSPQITNGSFFDVFGEAHRQA